LVRRAATARSGCPHDGFGLGRAIVASIAAIHGGTVIARPRGDGGLAVTVTLPRLAGRLAPRPASADPADLSV
jgi:signal transduction histidine kinase